MINLLTNTARTAILIWICTFIQIYWSMGVLTDNTSSGCLDCSFFHDAFFISLFSTLILTVLFVLLDLIKKNSVKVAAKWILLMAGWFFWDYTIFVDRESSWSTYDLKAEIYCTLYTSAIPIIILSAITLIILHLDLVLSKLKK
ncbi:hypothetical protein ACR780_09460 [Sphingobacterium faecium]|jgi:hypothetical protein|uniref:hypothetical protein n=1 Tax=Sphingobacterium faecium TaxID=34087 RepID=UPI0004E5FE9F|nr:conserved membrane hypothetical protein [Sphingobacterium sp. PM2-P1-29]